MRKYLLGAVALCALIGGCAAAARIPALQPPSVPKSAPLTVPAAAARVQPGKVQRGIDIDLYTWKGENFPLAAQYTLGYITSLHANAVMISFPFFADGAHSSTMHATAATPTPAQLGIVVSAARRLHLRVLIRPLLDEASLGKSRVNWVPQRPREWFASYQKFLLPYAAMAQRDHVSEFIVGAEFRHLGQYPGWKALDKTVARRYHGTLACSDNWDDIGRGGCGTKVQTVDAYPPVHGNLTAGWEAYDRTLPARSVLTEVDIAAGGLAGAPWLHTGSGKINQGIQVKWFTAACTAAISTHLGGIYFWSVGLMTSPGHGPTRSDPLAWAGGKGARAIEACFTRIERTR